MDLISQLYEFHIHTFLFDSNLCYHNRFVCIFKTKHSKARNIIRILSIIKILKPLHGCFIRFPLAYKAYMYSVAYKGKILLQNENTTISQPSHPPTEMTKKMQISV